MGTTQTKCEDTDKRSKYSVEDFAYNWWMNVGSIVVIAIFQVVLIYIGLLVYKKVKFNDLFMLTMIICLNLDIAGNLFFYALNAYSYKWYRLKDRDTEYKCF